MSFSYTARAAMVSSLIEKPFDLLVIGGGITGCGIALDAALRGMRVALVEQADFASGTSSRSTKLIHGGLRYLKQFELKLVHDVGRERSIVYRNARHIVIPEKMLLPIVKGGSLSASSTSIALWVYDFLAGVRKKEVRKMLSKPQTLTEEPLLNSEKVTGGGLYYEYRTDDARLVIEIAKSAAASGALCLNYVQVIDLLYDTHKAVSGVKVLDKISQQSFEIKAAQVVNAAGPFVDELRKTDQSLQDKRMLLTKGVHIVVPYTSLPIRHAVYFDVADGRMIFAIPRNGITYIGTTDTVYTGTIAEPRATTDDVVYLINATNAMFPKVQLQTADILSSWAGLRTLLNEAGKSPSELSRRDEVIVSPSGLVSIAGGKLTGYRLMASKVVDTIATQLKAKGKAFAASSTHDYRLSGGEFHTEADLETFAEKITHSAQYDYITSTIRHSWVYRYGSNTEKLLSIAEKLRGRFVDTDQFTLAAEMQYCFENELCTSEIDFAIRRTGMLYFDKVRLDLHLDFIHQYYSTLLERSSAEGAETYRLFKAAVAAVTDFGSSSE